jgi:hypothetical protein
MYAATTHLLHNAGDARCDRLQSAVLEALSTLLNSEQGLSDSGVQCQCLGM